MLDITMEKAQESYDNTFAVTYDGDNHIVLFGTNCNRCRKYFESDKLDVYCDKCKES